MHGDIAALTAPTSWSAPGSRRRQLNRDDEIARAIRQRDVEAVARLMFVGNPPSPRTGFRTETELWDFKADSPRPGRDRDSQWAAIAADVLAFHNSGGGVLVFGIRDDLQFSGASTRLDSKLINDQLRRYIGDTIWVEFHREFIQPDQRYLGLALVPPGGPTLERFRHDSPPVAGKTPFRMGDAAIRDRDSTRILRGAEADKAARRRAVPTVGRTYAVDDPFFRILAPEYDRFVTRPSPCKAVEAALHDPRSAVTAVLGIGGAGKTALATWAVLRAFERKDFDFIVSITAKDRQLTATGIQALDPPLSSFETLLEDILETLGFPELKTKPAEVKESQVRTLLDGTGGLLYIDNLESIQDARIIRFLDSLPVGARAIVTSRRAKVRVSVHPVDIGTLTPDEASEYVLSLASSPGMAYINDLKHPERVRIGGVCDGIPLAIRWALARSRSAGEAIVTAERITASGRHGEELLEFCFRRVFDSLVDSERQVLKVLSIFQRPLTPEAVLVGTDLPGHAVFDALDDLVSEALIVRLFDADKNDFAYGLLPVTRAFAFSEVAKSAGLEARIRKVMGDWFEARDIRDPDQRLLVREIRQGLSNPEAASLDLALAAERTGDMHSAQDFYEQAIQRNPRSWKAARLYGEFYRHRLLNRAEALRMYEKAASNAPSRGSERALIFREMGMLLRDSGDPAATDQAIQCFEVALVESPNDEVAIHALAHMLHRKGVYRRVIELLQPLVRHSNRTTRIKTLPLIADAYDRVGEMLKAAELRQEHARLTESRS